MERDVVSYLLKRMPADEIERYRKEGIPLEEVAGAVERMEARGELVEDTVNADFDPTAEIPPTLETISALDLQRKSVLPVKWVVKDLLPAGLNILASPPKYGKSWMVLDLGLAVTSGGHFLGYRTNRSEVLYLALEDSTRRLRTRMDKLLDGRQAPAGFFFATSSHDMDHGLLDELEDFLRGHPDTGLIVIDTFQRIRGTVHGREGTYAADYREVGSLKAFADGHNVALLLVHHLRKMKDEGDPFNMVSGTNGIMGAADTTLVLTKEKRNDENATLSATGRDIESADMVITFEKSTCRWQNLGNADAFTEQQARREYQNSPIVSTVKRLLEQAPDGSWSGSSQQLLDAGMFIAHTRLAPSPRELSGKLKDLSQPLLEYDSIVYTHARNGTGGGKHKFFRAEAPAFEEMPELDFDPFEGV